MEAPAWTAPPGQRATDEEYDLGTAPPDDRDYLDEAVRIATGGTLLMAETAHVQAMLQELCRVCPGWQPEGGRR